MQTRSRWLQTVRVLLVVGVIGASAAVPAVGHAADVSSEFSGHHVNAGRGSLR
jgi:hypothetical protein